MADQGQTEGKAKRARKASGPRTARPLYGVVRYTDENGAEVRLEKSRLNIDVVRDPGQLVELLEAGNATIVRIQLPQAAPAAPAA